MDTHDRQLEAMLRNRAAPQAPDGLAERIAAMAAAEGRGAQTVVRLNPQRGFWTELMQALYIPKPALAFAIVLLFGVMIGFDLGAVPVDDNVAGDWSSLFTSGEGWL